MDFLMSSIPLLMGFVLDLIFGDPYDLPHPVRLMGAFISALEKKLRGLFPKNERLGGAVLVIIVLAVSSLIPAALLFIFYHINNRLGIAAESVMCYYLLAAKCLKDESMKVYYAVREKDILKARRAVSMIVGRDTERLDEDGIIKAAVETVAENSSDGVAAPIFYIMLFGAAGGFFYKAANTMDSMLGYKNEKYLNFGRSAARLDDLLNFIPSRLTAVITVLSAYILGLNGKNSYKIWRRDRFNHASPNSAQTEAAYAGALDIMLGGDAYYFGELCRKKTIGDAVRPVENEDIVRADRLMYCASVIMLLIGAAVRAFLLGVIL